MGYNSATILWHMGKSAIHLVIILGNAIIAGPEVLAEPVETNYFVA